MGNFIESYFGNNFTNATSSFPAGMNFTNLVIAIPLAATILLFLINKSRALIDNKYIPSKLFGCQFQSVSLIIYTFSYAIFSSVLDLNYYLSIFILGYIPFIFLAWCIYKECDSEIACKFTSEVEYINNFILTIKDKIKTLESNSNPGNILINGAWGSGKSYMVQKHLLKSIPAIYLSCTDYTDLHELNTALIKKTNNCFIKFLLLLSLSRLIAIIGKTELKEYIGFNKVIVFDEFERLVDYNKIDPMHIVSLIQYLNHEKNCICILVANEDHLNDANQFTNVREKLISHTYHYKIPFDDVIKIIQDRNQIALSGSNQFKAIYQELKSRYNIDNNIRIIEHLYIKINQIYIKHKGFTEFKQKNSNVCITEEEFFALLFSNVLDLINPLYYLYLKNPYNLKAIRTLAIVYKYAAKEANNDLDNYLEQSSIQSLALKHRNTDVISYKNGNNELYDVSYDLNYIITNQNFEHIDAKLIEDFLGNEKIIIQLIFHNKEYGKTFNQNITIFMRLFKETFCEDDDQKLINNYFSSINVLEQRFSRLIDDVESPWDYSIVADYIAYCQYIDETYQRGNHNNIRPVSYNRITYINALIIQSMNDSTTDNFKLIMSEITNYINKTKNQLYQTQNFETLVYELTCIQAIEQNKVNIFIELIKQIADKLAEKYHPMLLLDFMYLSYQELKDTIDKERTRMDINMLRHFDMRVYPELRRSIIRCIENLISFSTEGSNTTEYLNRLFMHLSNFDVNISKTKNNKAFIALIVKIKEIYNTNELEQEFINTYKNHAWDIPKQVAKILQAELDAAAKSSNPKENPDDK